MDYFLMNLSFPRRRESILFNEIFLCICDDNSGLTGPQKSGQVNRTMIQDEFLDFYF
jgi:hypothetical protein